MCDNAMESNRAVMVGIIRSNRRVTRDVFLMIVTMPHGFEWAMPGQFVMVRVRGREFPFLPRPFSIHSLSREGEAATMEILYQVVGDGTRLLSSLGSGDELTILGPLGKGFDTRYDRRTVVLIAGGIGIAPLHFLAEYYNKRNVHGEEKPRLVCFMGARTADGLIGRERMEQLCDAVMVSTDDGSEGYCGTVTHCFGDNSETMDTSDLILYCCGPYGMMKRVALMAGDYSVPCQVSMEARMACGIGACLGCSVKMKSDDRPVRYGRVCKDGPVFDSKMIDW
jgi:dihydroorotate dehydrogenase electron transfer subunit